MPASFGITTNFGLTTPTGGTVEESSTEDEIEAKTIKDETGINQFGQSQGSPVPGAETLGNIRILRQWKQASGFGQFSVVDYYRSVVNRRVG